MSRTTEKPLPARRFLLLSAIAVASAVTGLAYPAEKPVYGTDDRVEMFQSDATLCKVGVTVAALFPRELLDQVKQNQWQLNTHQTLQDAGWCADERFATQQTGAICSAFLIAHDKIATAAHCLNATDDLQGGGLNCADAVFVFDHKLAIDGELNQYYDSTQIYYCKSILGGHESKTGADWRVAQLQRKTHRKPIPVYINSGELPPDSQIDVVGHPLGLPMKAAGNGSVSNSTAGAHFQARIDAYEGNSGSPVVARINNQAVVIGLLAGGEQDAVVAPADLEGDCKRSRVCESGDCAGEHVTHARVLAPWAHFTITDNALAMQPEQVMETCLWCSDSLFSLQWQCPASPLSVKPLFVKPLSFKPLASE